MSGVEIPRWQHVTRAETLAFADEAFRNSDINFSHRDIVDMTGALDAFLRRRARSTPRTPDQSPPDPAAQNDDRSPSEHDGGVTQVDRDVGLVVWQDYLNGKLEDVASYEGEQCAIHAASRVRLAHATAAQSLPPADGEREAAWNMLCERLQRDPSTSEESDTITLRSACRAMIAFAALSTPRDDVREPADVRPGIAEPTDAMLDALFPSVGRPAHYMGTAGGRGGFAKWLPDRKEQRARYTAMLAASPTAGPVPATDRAEEVVRLRADIRHIQRNTATYRQEAKKQADAANERAAEANKRADNMAEANRRLLAMLEADPAALADTQPATVQEGDDALYSQWLASGGSDDAPTITRDQNLRFQARIDRETRSRSDSWANTPEAEHKRILLMAEIELHLKSCRIFLTSREKMHPVGVDIHDELLAKMTAAIEATGSEKSHG